MEIWFQIGKLLYLFPTIWWLDVSQRREKTIQENAFEQKKKTGPWIAFVHFIKEITVADWFVTNDNN